MLSGPFAGVRAYWAAVDAAKGCRGSWAFRWQFCTGLSRRGSRRLSDWAPFRYRLAPVHSGLLITPISGSRAEILNGIVERRGPGRWRARYRGPDFRFGRGARSGGVAPAWSECWRDDARSGFELLVGDRAIAGSRECEP